MYHHYSMSISWVPTPEMNHYHQQRSSRRSCRYYMYRPSDLLGKCYHCLLTRREFILYYLTSKNEWFGYLRCCRIGGRRRRGSRLTCCLGAILSSCCFQTSFKGSVVSGAWSYSCSRFSNHHRWWLGLSVWIYSKWRMKPVIVVVGLRRIVNTEAG